MKYNDDNLEVLFKKLDVLIKKENKVSFTKLKEFVKKKLGEYEPGGAERYCFGKSKFYDCLIEPALARGYIKEPAFKYILKYIEIVQPNTFIIEKNEASKYMYASLSGYLSLNDLVLEEAKSSLIGRYRTYRPSIGKEGYVVLGLLDITLNSENNALEMYELMAYKRRMRIDGNEKSSEPIQAFFGYIWPVMMTYYKGLTYDSSTNLPQDLILRSAGKENGKILSFEGSYSGVTNKRGATNIFWSKIFIERLDESKSDSRKKALLSIRGYKKKEDISEEIWAYIDPEKDNLILF